MRITRIVSVLALCLISVSVHSQDWNSSLASADSLFAVGEQDSAIALVEATLNRAEKQLGQDDLQIAPILRKLGTYYYSLADYASAETYHKRALGILERTLTPDDTVLGTACFELAGDYLFQEKLDLAAPLFYQSLQIRERALGGDHPEVARSLNAIAVVLIYKQKFRDALPYSERALSIWEKTLGPEHPNTAKALTNIANARKKLGDLNTAESLFVKLLYLREKQFGPEHYEVASIELGLADARLERGDYVGAKPHMERAIAIRKTVYGDDHQQTAEAMVDLATLLLDQAQYAEAEQLFLRAIRVLEKSGGQSGHRARIALRNLADLYIEVGDFASASRLIRQALIQAQASRDKNTPEFGDLISLLGDIADYTGEYAVAESLYLTALPILEENYGRSHGTLVGTLNGIAITLSKQGDYSQAEPYYRRALEISKAGGTEHRLLANTLEYHAGYLEAVGKTHEAQEQFGRALGIRQSEFRSLVPVLTEHAALKYGSIIRKSFDHFMSAHTETMNEPSIATTMLVKTFAIKGSVTDEFIERNRWLRGVESDTSGILTELYRAKQRLSHLFVSETDSDPDSPRRQDSLSHLIDSLEEQIARSDSSRTRTDRRGQPTIGDYQSRIPRDGALIEYVQYTKYAPLAETGESRYLAFVLRDKGVPLAVDIGPGSVIDSLIRNYRVHIERIARQNGQPSKEENEEYRKIAEELTRVIWSPIQGSLPDSGLLIISPDGLLNLVSFAGLPFGDKQYLVEKYAIQYLSSGRDLVRIGKKSSSGSGLLAIGDPDFNATPNQTVDSKSSSSAEIYPSGAAQLRSAPGDCLDLSNLNVQRLPGTRSEVEIITGLWQRSRATASLQLIGEKASEGSFKKHAVGKQVIHLATHGYYTPPYCVGADADRYQNWNRKTFAANPLLTSGLFLAGANRNRERVDTLGEDGILTAEEVSTLDLTGTERVVLSACESGLGEIASGEGIYGIRRAFLMAGAECVISSLWPVPDNVTSQLMSSVYAGLSGGSAAQLRSGMLTMIERLRKRGQPDHPFLWGSFVSTGDWRK